MKTLLIASALVILTAGCGGATNPPLQAPLQRLDAVALDTAQTEVEINSKVDILFVVDNSLSMDRHQENLAANIDRFVNAFAKNSLIDFHIGVTTIYDSQKAPRIKNFNPQGQLLPLKIKGQAVDAGPRFISRDTPDYVEVLRDTLKVGTMQGPEFEESFSPVPAALSVERSRGANAGFYRPEAYLVPIFLTDADDSSPDLSPDELYFYLLSIKSDRKKIMPVGVLSPSSEPSCHKDPSGAPFRIEKFLAMSGGRELSLCSSHFGGDLAQIGIDFSERVSRQVIKLNAVPDPTTIRVRYGSQEIPADGAKGWSYDAKNQSVIISAHTDLKPESGAVIHIEFVPVQLTNVVNGRAKRY